MKHLPTIALVDLGTVTGGGAARQKILSAGKAIAKKGFDLAKKWVGQLPTGVIVD